MNKFLEICLILTAGAVVAVADVIIKKIVFTGIDFKTALKDPRMLLVLGLYMVQIILFLYLFTTKSYLSFVGIGQAVIYTIIVIGSGTLLFNEAITFTQAIG